MSSLIVTFFLIPESENPEIFLLLLPCTDFAILRVLYLFHSFEKCNFHFWPMLSHVCGLWLASAKHGVNCHGSEDRDSRVNCESFRDYPEITCGL